MANQWFKFYGGEYLSDPKIERLTPLERSCWVTLLCLASMMDSGTIEFLTVESLLNKSGIQFDPYRPEEWENALSVMQKFQKMKMIKLMDNGDIKIINWEKRQEHNLTVAERVAKHRAKKQVCNKDVTINVTSVTTEENRIEENRREYTFSDEKDTQPLKADEALSEDFSPELCFAGFPLPEGWQEDSIVDDSGNGHEFLLDENNQKVKEGVIKKLKREYDNRMRMKQPSFVQRKPDFNSEEEIQKLKNSSKLELQIIGLYLSAKGIELSSRAELDEIINRNFKMAKSLTSFKGKITGAMKSEVEKAQEQTREKGKPDYDWKLSTILKKLT